jgi:hypothetical protein
LGERFRPIKDIFKLLNLIKKYISRKVKLQNNNNNNNWHEVENISIKGYYRIKYGKILKNMKSHIKLRR